jgi:hypothetical protein
MYIVWEKIHHLIMKKKIVKFLFVLRNTSVLALLFFLFNPEVHRVLNCVYRYTTMSFNEPAINPHGSDIMCFQKSCEKRLFKINP